MAHNFLEVEGGTNYKNKDTRIHVYVMLFLLFISLGGLLLRKYSSEKDNNFILANVLEPIKKVANIKNEVGGDIQVAPPIKPQLPELTGEMLDSEQFSADCMLVRDVKSGKLLFQKNEYTPHALASISKLMSALVILEKDIDWTATTTVIGDDSLGTHIYAGDVYTLEQLWNVALVASSNKAVLSIVNYLDWPEEAFVERMNQKAQELGLLDTRFVEPTGLDENNISTASDISLLLSDALRHNKIKDSLLLPEYNLYSKQRATAHHVWNTNWLLLGWVENSFADILGGKTGFINLAKYNFTVRLADEFGHQIDVVILGADTHEARFTEARDVANWVFANYKWPEVQ